MPDATSSGDKVVASDPWAFVLDEDIFGPALREDFSVWLFRYRKTRDTGKLFPLTFTAMSAKMWELLLYDADPERIYSRHKDILSSKHSTNVDELIVTRLLLENRVCHLPAHNLAWKKVDLTPPSAANPVRDAFNCFHGYEWEPCDASGRFRSGCLWWRLDAKLDSKTIKDTFLTIKDGKEEDLAQVD